MSGSFYLFLVNIPGFLIAAQTLSPSNYQDIKDTCEQFAEWATNDLFN